MRAYVPVEIRVRIERVVETRKSWKELKKEKEKLRKKGMRIAIKSAEELSKADMKAGKKSKKYIIYYYVIVDYDY